MRRAPWALLIGIAFVAVLVLLVRNNWHEINEAIILVSHARPGWLVVAFATIVVGYYAAGQVYGRVLSMLGYRANPFWLAGTAFVALLISQSIPAGTVGSYAFLTATLRRRGLAPTSVALVASMELLSWIGAMLLLLCFGLTYTVFVAHGGGPPVLVYPAAGVALSLLGGGLFLFTRPRATLHGWGMWLKRALDRLVGPIWSESLVLSLVDEIEVDRRLVRERPGQIALLVGGQLVVFALHGFALLAVLYAVGASTAFPAVLAAFGLALIVSSFTLLPGGGGTVEAALTLSLTAQGVDTAAALGAAVVFRLLNFWLLLPLGALCYRLLTRSGGEVALRREAVAPSEGDL
jgi:putative heme transporter